MVLLLLISDLVRCLYFADRFEDILCGTFNTLWKPTNDILFLPDAVVYIMQRHLKYVKPAKKSIYMLIERHRLAFRMHKKI